MIDPYYQDGSVTIYHGDAREVLPTLPLPDLIVVDPPYGINYSTNLGDRRIKGNPSWANTVIENDADALLRDWLIESHANIPMAVFGSWKIEKPSGVRQVLIWDKGPAFGMGDLSFPWKNSFEEIYILGEGWQGRRDEAVLRGHLVVSWESQGRCHPNQKPVSLMRYLISKHPTAQMISDPCMGSGSTLRAAKDLGRKAIGIEIEEHYCELAVSRMAQEVFEFA